MYSKVNTKLPCTLLDINSFYYIVGSSSCAEAFQPQAAAGTCVSELVCDATDID